MTSPTKVIIKGDLVSPAPLTAPPIENSIAIKGCMIPSIHTNTTVLLMTSISLIKKPASSLENIANRIKNRESVYNLSIDKRTNKFTSGVKLKILDENELPEYLMYNKNKFKDWLE